MILPSETGENPMIEREMIRVQDQDQLDTKPPLTCNGKSSTKTLRPASSSPIEVTMKISRSSHLPGDCAPCTLFKRCSKLRWTEDRSFRPGNDGPTPS